MEVLTRIDLIVAIKNLDTITKFMNKENFYDMIVKFYSITSELHDHVEEFQDFPLRGRVFLGIKSKKRKMAEKAMSEFIAVIKEYGRGCSCNKSKKGQTVTKDNIYLDAGIDWFSISILEIDNRYSEYLDIDAHIAELKAINLNLDWIA